MGRTRKVGRSDRAQMRHFATSVTFPRWLTVPLVLLISLVLWLGALQDPLGNLKPPGIGSFLYVVAVIGVATFLACAGRNGKNRKHTGTFKSRHKADLK
jgi:hypothetical protein